MVAWTCSRLVAARSPKWIVMCILNRNSRGKMSKNWKQHRNYHYVPDIPRLPSTIVGVWCSDPHLELLTADQSGAKYCRSWSGEWRHKHFCLVGDQLLVIGGNHQPNLALLASMITLTCCKLWPVAEPNHMFGVPTPLFLRSKCVPSKRTDPFTKRDTFLHCTVLTWTLWGRSHLHWQIQLL